MASIWQRLDGARDTRRLHAAEARLLAFLRGVSRRARRGTPGAAQGGASAKRTASRSIATE